MKYLEEVQQGPDDKNALHKIGDGILVTLIQLSWCASGTL